MEYSTFFSQQSIKQVDRKSIRIIGNLDNIDHQLHLIDIYVTHHPTKAEYASFSSVREATKIDNILDMNTNHNIITTYWKRSKP